MLHCTCTVRLNLARETGYWSVDKWAVKAAHYPVFPPVTHSFPYPLSPQTSSFSADDRAYYNHWETWNQARKDPHKPLTSIYTCIHVFCLPCHWMNCARTTFLFEHWIPRSCLVKLMAPAITFINILPQIPTAKPRVNHIFLCLILLESATGLSTTTKEAVAL